MGAISDLGWDFTGSPKKVPGRPGPPRRPPIMKRFLPNAWVRGRGRDGLGFPRKFAGAPDFLNPRRLKKRDVFARACPPIHQIQSHRGHHS